MGKAAENKGSWGDKTVVRRIGGKIVELTLVRCDPRGAVLYNGLQ